MRPAGQDLLDRLLGPGEPEVGCETCFDELDHHVDVELRSGPAAADAAVPGMRAHLRGCPACADEHASLLGLAGRWSPPGTGGSS